MDENELANRFSYHAPKGNQSTRYEEIREMGRNFAELILSECPASREQSIAITKIEEAVFWANASIARRE